MLFQKIMIPFDGSDHARRALDIALGMVGDRPSAELHVISVVPIAPVDATAGVQGFWTAAPFVFGGYEGQEKVVDDTLSRAEKELAEAVRAQVRGYSCQVVVGAVAYSSPADGIIDYVDRHECDLIIMGRRGLGKLRGMLGSVSTGVLSNTDIPVMTVK